jgi:CMP-N,N'-diacetyllegionaminic acid synthase
MKLLITICARGGSKGIPSKNIKELAGLPLIAYSIKIAQEFAGKTNGDIALSTDGLRIKETAEKFGLYTDYLRPEYLATDTAGKMDTLKDVMLYHETKHNTTYDYLLDLDVTSPLRTVQDLEQAFDRLIKNGEALNIFSVSKAHRNPYFNMVEQGPDGYYQLVKTPENPILSRQTAPKVYDLNASFYFYRRRFFDMDFKNAYTPKSLIYEVPHTCFDLDEPVDFEFMGFLIENNKLDFDLLR